MIRLTQSGWNNVIILACLLMLILFSTTNNMLVDNSDGGGSETLLPDGVPVMTLDFGSHKIERIGQGWRSKPVLQLSEAELATLINNWQQAQGTVVPNVQLASPYVAVAWLAGENQGRVFRLHQQGADVLVTDGRYTLLLANQSLSAFIPQELH